MKLNKTTSFILLFMAIISYGNAQNNLDFSKDPAPWDGSKGWHAAQHKTALSWEQGKLKIDGVKKGTGDDVGLKNHVYSKPIFLKAGDVVYLTANYTTYGMGDQKAGIRLSEVGSIKHLGGSITSADDSGVLETRPYIVTPINEELGLQIMMWMGGDNKAEGSVTFNNIEIHTDVDFDIDDLMEDDVATETKELKTEEKVEEKPVATDQNNTFYPVWSE